MRTPALAGLGLFTLLGACAPTVDRPAGDAAETTRQCFLTQQVTNFRQGRPDQVFLRVGRSDVYELTAAGGCGDLNFANQLAIVPDFGGAAGSRVCADDFTRIIVPGSVNRTAVCRARISRKLSEADVAALPERYRP